MTEGDSIGARVNLESATLGSASEFGNIGPLLSDRTADCENLYSSSRFKKKDYVPSLVCRISGPGRQSYTSLHIYTHSRVRSNDIRPRTLISDDRQHRSYLIGLDLHPDLYPIQTQTLSSVC